MSFFEAPSGQIPPPVPQRGRRASRVLFLISAVLAVAFLGTFYLDELPLPVRTWVAESVPAARGLVGIPPDPEAEVADLAERMQLTAEGRLIFYDAEPAIVDGADIARICTDGEELPGGLYHAGCYLGTDRIFLLREPRTPVLVTTAAHELLHAVYRRMDDAERARADALVTVEMARVPSSDPVHAQIEASVGDNSSARPDERFAYLGSQIVLDGGFASELETLYARYFEDRTSLASASSRY
ncbi:hypothetical protein [Microbacterium invictum]|uniref:Uncharacterized protein n=1 Tax=Microbacterium invictum TaxID=515415 RepID=A0AA40SPD3_9MICO|nr:MULTISPECIES: hypothetical protein [Microbacterium]MBB4139896.1 hypothetical protein [Microbacterium invictum]